MRRSRGGWGWSGLPPGIAKLNIADITGNEKISYISYLCTSTVIRQGWTPLEKYSGSAPESYNLMKWIYVLTSAEHITKYRLWCGASLLIVNQCIVYSHAIILSENLYHEFSFSSPEPKAQVSFFDRNLSVVRRRRRCSVVVVVIVVNFAHSLLLLQNHWANFS